VGEDDAVVEKWRGLQETISLSLSHHLPMAQCIFGSSVGLGFLCQLTCSLGRLGRSKKSRPVEATDTLNIIPFDEEGHGEELIRKGLVLKYLPCLCVLTVIVRFRRVNEQQNLLPHLQQRGMIHSFIVNNPNDADKWPL
jgi:hypothetical protein